MGSAFTYQGRLIDANDTADGLYDFQFKLYDDPNVIVGRQVGATIDINELDVIDGYFTAVLDFGAGVFDGDGRWLEIAVRPGEFEDLNEYNLLSPRQQITPAPYAIDANTLSGHKVSDFASASHHHDARYVNTDGDKMVAQVDGWWIYEVENTGKGTGIESRAFTDAICGVASADGGTGVRGEAGGEGGYGVYGYASDPDSYAVYGKAICATNNKNYGGYFTAAGKYGRGVYGEGTGESGRGVLGDATGLYGTGAQGTATGQYGMGVYGFASGNNSKGVVGISSGASGRGVYGSHSGSNNFGYLASSEYGAYGKFNANANYGYLGGSSYGVYGLHGQSGRYGYIGGNDYAVYGYYQDEWNENYGYIGGDKEAVYGHSDWDSGVKGYSHRGYGVYGYSDASDGYGVYGQNDDGGYAGFFRENVMVLGRLDKGSGSFKIDHPLDPENKYLCHSFVESPDMKNVYDGVVKLGKKGQAWVQLPDYFEVLNCDFRYQLTCIGSFASVYIAEEISNNRFKIAGGKHNMKVSWQVTGIRHDPYAVANRIQVEEDKSTQERGYYAHPTAYGLSDENGIKPVRSGGFSETEKITAKAGGL